VYLGAGEDAAGRDPAVGEAHVVRASVERNALGRQALRLPEIAEHSLDLSRPGRTGDVFPEYGAVAVVDEAGEVRRGDHVGVDHHHDLVHLGLREIRGVVLRALGGFRGTRPSIRH
jgi:hypothetical protein